MQMNKSQFTMIFFNIVGSQCLFPTAPIYFSYQLHFELLNAENVSELILELG